MTGWDDPRNAELYDRFARDYGLYRDTSRDLVQLARIEAATLVIDLACGTGVTTEEILARARQSTNVVALDRSEAMLAIARRRVSDQRVRWVCSAAVDLAEHAHDADAIICNSAIWQLGIEPTIVAAARSLWVGGRLAFNVGSPFLTLPSPAEELRPATPTFYHLIRAVAVLDYGFVPPHPARSQERPLTRDAVVAMIVRAGLMLDQTETLEYDSPPEAQLARLRVPIFVDNVLPGMAYDQQLEVIEKAFERFDRAHLRIVWMAFVAHRA